jgi:uncharacterized protein (TIGR00661 family)
MNKRVLVMPMDWGLGHATRCIPVIRVLLEFECEVFLAGSGDGLALLKREFPTLPSFTLTGYAPSYDGHMITGMLQQLPQFLRTIRDEHDQVEELVRKHQIDFVISDNRYGAWASTVPSVFITHQLTIDMPSGFSWLGPMVNYLNHRFIRRFTQCWVPDEPDVPLAGKLARADSLQQVRYIGALSRFEKQPDAEKKYDLLLLLSGPEPARTQLETILRAQLPLLSLRYLLVRGKVEDLQQEPNIVNFLSAQELNEVMEQSELVISRSGYSTIMDLSRLGKKAVLIPTPGQTEQEYLARFHGARGTARWMEQTKVDLNRAWLERHNFSGFRDHPQSPHLRTIIEELLTQK